jgi:hypothetical protein
MFLKSFPFVVGLSIKDIVIPQNPNGFDVVMIQGMVFMAFS